MTAVLTPDMGVALPGGSGIADDGEVPHWDEFGSPLNWAAVCAPDWGLFLERMRFRALPRACTVDEFLDEGAYAEITATMTDNQHLVTVQRGFEPGHDYRVATPGHVAAIRLGIAAATASGVTQRLIEWLRHSSDPEGPELVARMATDIGGALLGAADAVPFYLEGGIAQALLASEPPTDDLVSQFRLPYPNVLLFFPSVPLTGVLGDEFNFQTMTGLDLNVRDVDLVGVTLFSGTTGEGLLPYYAAVLTAADPSGSHDRQIIYSPGLWARSQIRHVALNAAALLTWGQWTTPEPPPVLGVVPGSRDWRKAMKKSGSRKALDRGRFSGVHLIEFNARASGRDSDGENAGRRSPTTHLRRGHWRGVWVGPRDSPDRRLEGRWITPTVVNPGSTLSPTVYRVQG